MKLNPTMRVTTNSPGDILSSSLGAINNNTENQLQNIKHIWYEIGMLFKCYKEILKKNINSDKSESNLDNSFENNVILECFLIHYRGLVAFFNNNPKIKQRDDDIYADCFGFVSTNIVYNQEDINRIHKEIAHITTNRNISNKEWDINEFINKIKPSCEAFIQFITSKYKSELNLDKLNEWANLEEIMKSEEI
jgi:hypothetical protein